MSVPGGSNFTYYYKVNDPGLYPYHCHVEPTEHLELGMVGIIAVAPAQSGDPLFGGLQYAYNDGGLAPNTQYDVSYDLHIHDLDSRPHYNLETVQEGTTDWPAYSPNYFTFNGRGYPDTLLPEGDARMTNGASAYGSDYVAQPQSSLISANSGDRILLRLMNLSYRSHTVAIPGIPMHVVGEDARLLRGPAPTNADLSFMKTTYPIAGGKSADIILDTAGLTSGTYFLYGRELYSQASLSLEDRDAGAGAGAANRNGLITEIRIN